MAINQTTTLKDTMFPVREEPAVFQDDPSGYVNTRKYYFVQIWIKHNQVPATKANIKSEITDLKLIYEIAKTSSNEKNGFSNGQTISW